jgi:hypothetical protein
MSRICLALKLMSHILVKNEVKAFLFSMTVWLIRIDKIMCAEFFFTLLTASHRSYIIIVKYF